MAEAKPSLSPKALERMRRHRHAVMVLAMQQAKRLAQRQLQAQGLKLAHFSAKEINSWPRLSSNVIALGSLLLLNRRSTRGRGLLICD
jgi:hypothetical protein